MSGAPWIADVAAELKPHAAAEARRIERQRLVVCLLPAGEPKRLLILSMTQRARALLEEGRDGEAAALLEWLPAEQEAHAFAGIEDGVC